MLTARCLCGSIEIAVSGKVGPLVYCHCSRCRKSSGTAFSANVNVRRKYWRFVSGEERIREFESSSRSASGAAILRLDRAAPRTARARREP